MRDFTNPVIVRVCLGCKHYTIIYPENASNGRFIRLFDFWHSGHLMQTINIKELDPSYTCITEKKRERIHEVLNK